MYIYNNAHFNHYEIDTLKYKKHLISTNVDFRCKPIKTGNI